MAKRKMPERYKTGPKKGQFKPRSKSRSRQTSSRKTTAVSKAPRKRTYRRNPRRPDVVKMLTSGTITATQVLAGKAATRAVPDVLNLPKAGNAGLAVQVATALGLGYVSSMFFTQSTAAAILAGAMTAPVETAIQVANIPYLSRYLSPAAQAEAVEGYKRPGGVRGYVMPPGGVRRGRAQLSGVSGYVQPRGGAEMDDLGNFNFN